MQEISVLKAELVELKDSQKFISSQYDDLKQDYDNLLLTNKQQEDEMKRLQTNYQLVAKKEAKESENLDALEQYERGQNLEFTGIPKTQGENTCSSGYNIRTNIVYHARCMQEPRSLEL